MTEVSDIDQLICSMRADMLPGIYVFATTQDPGLAHGVSTLMTFHEAEGLTLILTVEEAERLDLPYDSPCRMITLNIHSCLEEVGFTAKIASHLAKLGIGVNPVSAYYHDHLFVPEAQAQEALEALESLAREGVPERRG